MKTPVQSMLNFRNEKKIKISLFRFNEDSIFNLKPDRSTRYIILVNVSCYRSDKVEFIIRIK